MPLTVNDCLKDVNLQKGCQQAVQHPFLNVQSEASLSFDVKPQTACTSRLSAWCKPSGTPLEGRAALGTPNATAMDGSIIQAVSGSCAAALTQAAHLSPFYSLFAAALTDAVAALGAALQFVAMDRQFVDSPCRDACRVSCQILKSVFMPPMQ